MPLNEQLCHFISTIMHNLAEWDIIIDYSLWKADKVEIYQYWKLGKNCEHCMQNNKYMINYQKLINTARVIFKLLFFGFACIIKSTCFWVMTFWPTMVGLAEVVITYCYVLTHIVIGWWLAHDANWVHWLDNLIFKYILKNRM